MLNPLHDKKEAWRHVYTGGGEREAPVTTVISSYLAIIVAI